MNTTPQLTRRRWTALALTLTFAGAVRAQPRGWRIEHAEYGTPGRSVDVTERLRALARDNQTFRIANDTFQVDPDQGHTKALRITTRGPDGARRVFQYREGEVVDGARFAGWRDGNWGPDRADQRRDRDDRDGYRIVQALYGTGRRNVDVTARLRELARADQRFRISNDTFGTDPAEGRVKTLRIYARRHGQERMFEYREGSVVDGARFVGWGGGEWGEGDRRGGWDGRPGPR